MRYFVTGASGWIGSAVTAELIENGHEVVGLARSDASAAAVEKAGGIVQRGDLTDHHSLRAGADGADGIVHTGFIHDFSAFENSVKVDADAVALFGDLLEGTDKPLVIASGILGTGKQGILTENDRYDLDNPNQRAVTEAMLLGFADRGVRSAAVRLAPTVHGQGDHGFIASMVQMDRANGTAAYIGDGTNRWPGVHRLDAAHLFCLALEKAPAGSALHAIADEGVEIKTIAEIVGRHLDLPVVSVEPEKAADTFSWLGRFLALDCTASSAITRELVGWEPTHPSLIEDLEAGYYFAG